MNLFRPLLVAFMLTICAQAQQRPFPQHTPYTSGSIRPSQATQSALDQTTATFYDAWKARYVTNGCAPGQYYVFYNREGQASPKNAVACSEGHGYGMLITAFMAGHDPDARKLFDGLYVYFRAHPATGNTNLMAWQQITGCVNAPGGDDTATDGDLDIAYALLLAHAQWGSQGAINYQAEARKVIAAIKRDEINSQFNSVRLGNWATEKKWANSTRASDFVPDHFRAFERATGDHSWPAVTEKCLAIIESIQTGPAAKTGLVPDFIINVDTTPRPPEKKLLESKHDGDYNYNSCRVPWRLTVDYLLNGDPRAKRCVQRINAFIRQQTKGKPEAIRAGYHLASGKPIDPDDIAMAFEAPFAVGAMVDASNQAWLNALWDDIAAKSTIDSDYFGNTLKVLCLITLSGNWWAPQ